MNKSNNLVLGLSLLLFATALQARDTFKPQFVDTLVGPYLAIQKGLAGDNLIAAKAGAKSFLEAVKMAPHGEDESEVYAVLSAPAKAIAKANEIKAARSTFLGLSKEMTSLIKEVGTTNNIPLFIAHCPMAFGNKGGSWLQADKTVTNPYFGSSMLHCGVIKEKVARGKGDSDHGEHQH